MLGYETIGSATIGGIAQSIATGPPPTGTVTLQASDGGQGRRFVLTTSNAISGSILFDGTGGTADFGPVNFAIASNAADFTVPGIPAGSYTPIPTVYGADGNAAIATGAAAFTINGVSGGGEIPVPVEVLAVTVTPTAGIILNGSLDFDAVATGLNNPAQTFDWETDLGVVNLNGTVTVVRTTQAQTGHVTARSKVDPTKFATVTFTVPALDVVIDPPDDGEESIPVPEEVKVSVSRILRTKAENSSLRDGPDVAGDTYMLRQGVWVIMKDKDDSLYYARDVEPLLLAAETTIDSVVAVVEGVEVKQGPTVRGTLIITKIAGGDADMGIDVQNMLTLRIKFGNGEVQDLSIYFGIKER